MLGASLFLGAIFFSKKKKTSFKGNILSQIIFLLTSICKKKIKNQKLNLKKKSIPQ
jgi:hypothetical protein